MQVDRVMISSFTLKGIDAQSPTTDFTLGGDLVYTAELDTISLIPGTYELSVSAIKDNQSGVILDDWFVLEPAP